MSRRFPFGVLPPPETDTDTDPPAVEAPAPRMTRRLHAEPLRVDRNSIKSRSS